MPSPDEGEEPDLALARALGSLASPPRLHLLRQLRAPKSLSEIEVRGARSDADRVIARQTIRQHVARLMEAGLVLRRDARRAYGPTQEFVLNHQTVYALAEEVRALARVRAAVEPFSETAPVAPVAPTPVQGPSLVVVKGLEEGQAFDLSPRGGAREWVVGRRRGLAVALDFDPYVSAENAVVAWEGGRHVVADVPGSRNGTSVNFRLLGPDERRALRHGDVVGVGRTLLLYWA